MVMMRIYKYILVSLGIFCLFACDKKVATLEQTKNYYAAMSDDEIKQRYRLMTMNSCMDEIKKMLPKEQSQLNSKALCQCATDKFLDSMPIETIRLSMLPAEALSDKQKRDLDYKIIEITQNELPKCFRIK